MRFIILEENFYSKFIVTSILNKIVTNFYFLDLYICLSFTISNFILEFQTFFNEEKQKKN